MTCQGHPVTSRQGQSRGQGCRLELKGPAPTGLTGHCSQRLLRTPPPPPAAAGQISLFPQTTTPPREMPAALTSHFTEE